MEELGLVHYYYGDGKGKTTAAMGLLLRAAGWGIPAAVVQFLKNGSSGEMRALEAFPHVVEMAVKCQKGFSFSMNAEEREECAAVMRENLEKAEQLCREGRCRLLVLDEIGSALDAGMVDRKGFLAFLDHRPAGVEVVMTGHRRDGDLAERADYVTQMRKEKHPYDCGTAARDGVER